MKFRHTFINFVPNYLINVDERNLLEWPKKYIKQYIKNGRKKGDHEKLLNMTTNITAEISNRKKNYFDNLAEKFCGPNLNQNAY